MKNTISTKAGDDFIDENPHRKYMSDAWEYKEATWSEVRYNPFRFRVCHASMIDLMKKF